MKRSNINGPLITDVWKISLILSLLGCSIIYFLVTYAEYSSAQILVGQKQNESKDVNDLFRVSFTLFGVNENTGNVLLFVKVNNVTAARFFNATNTDRIDRDGIVDVVLSFPNETVSAGANFTACNLLINEVTLSCEWALNVPGRTQVLQMVLPTYNQRIGCC